MAYFEPENLPVCINIDTDDTDLSHLIEVPAGEIIDSGILMSLLDESQMEYYCDDEKLTSVIQSLEAELEYCPISIINNQSSPNFDCYKGDCVFADDMGSEYSSAPVDADFSWMNMEIEFSDMIEFQVGTDYSQDFNGIEEEVYDSLWLETDLSMSQ